MQREGQGHPEGQQHLVCRGNGEFGGVVIVVVGGLLSVWWFWWWVVCVGGVKDLACLECACGQARQDVMLAYLRIRWPIIIP